MSLIYDLPANVPIWTLNAVEEYRWPRLDRAFEMHPLRDIVLETPRWERLHQELPYPTYMLEQHDEIPSSVAYPIEDVSRTVFRNIYVGEANAVYYDSSLAYMIGLAVHEGYQAIFVIGFELLSDTEYRYQRPGAALLAGIAGGMGVQVLLPEDTGLLPHTLYGYEDYQMISRQNLEQMLFDMQSEESEWQGRINVAHTQVVERVKAGAAQEEIEKAVTDRDDAYRQMYMRSGAIHAITHLISICDRKEIKMAPFTDPFRIYEHAEQV